MTVSGVYLPPANESRCKSKEDTAKEKTFKHRKRDN